MKTKKLSLTAFVALCVMTCVSFTSCTETDNPVNYPQEATMAETIKLHTAKQSFYKLGTKEVLPLYVVVYSNYVDENGETKYYNLSNITDVKIDNEMFIVDTTNLIDHGYIKLIPNEDGEAFQELKESVEDYGAYDWSIGSTMTIKNKKGETFTQEIELSYVFRNEFEMKETCKVSDLNEDNQYVLKVTQPFGLFDWTFSRYNDNLRGEMVSFWNAKLQKDGFLYLTTDGLPTEPDEPNTLDYNYTRTLVGFPNPELPEGEGVMVNFHIYFELNVTE